MARGGGVVAAPIAACALLVCALVWPAPGAAAPGQDPSRSCEPSRAPFGDLPGAELIPEVHEIEGSPGGAYVRWRGFVPTFDGMPLSVDVTVPCGVEGPQPTVVMAHGFTDDKTVWEETGKSDSVHSEDRAGNDRWNNVWFASRGYTVLNYTARGWRDSCGPDTPGHSVEAPAPQCAPFEFWLHLNDKRWEVRDAQWLAGALVQGGSADPERLAITGGSYGGGPTSMGALLADRMVCGAAPVPAELGPDPCAEAGDGELVPWTTPDGETPLIWAAALPLYTYADLLQVLAPNGRWSDGWGPAPAAASPVEPFGVPLEGTVSGLLTAATLFGSVAPAGSDPDSDLRSSTERLVAGDPFPSDDPEVVQGIELYRDRRSPVSIEPQGRVPIFWVQGLTDALFPGSEALTIRDHLLAADPDYPIKVFLADIGHDYSAERRDEWDIVKPLMNDFLDHHLRPDRTPAAPAYDIGATITRCLDEEAPPEHVAAATWHELHPGQVTFTSDEPGTTSTATVGPSGAATDPISGATLPGPDSYKGCRIVRPAADDPTVVTREFELEEDLTLLGGVVVELDVTAEADGIPVAVRLWDVAADGSEQGLVARGVHRIADPAVVDGTTVSFQLSPQGYRFPAGHRLKVEVTGNDSPYLQQSNVDAAITVERLGLTVPVAAEASDPASAEGGRPGVASEPAPAGSGTAWWLGGALVVVAGAGLAALARRRRRPAR